MSFKVLTEVTACTCCPFYGKSEGYCYELDREVVDSDLPIELDCPYDNKGTIER
jgi:hypothetical protein